MTILECNSAFRVLKQLLFCNPLQAQKFVGVKHELAQECVHNIRLAKSPEVAARLGRTLARQRPDLVRAQLEVSQNLEHYFKPTLIGNMKCT